MKFKIDRIEVPEWVEASNHWDAHDWLGEQAEFAFAVPWTFQILSAPRARHIFVRAPRVEESSWPLALGYWHSCLNLLIYGFGWSRPDRGLHWWYENGFPTDDPKLALLRQVWLVDGQLDWLAAWLWTTNQMSYAGALGHWPADDWVPVKPSWVRRAVSSAESSGIPNPLGGGTDPLHLSAHCRGPLEDSPYGVPSLVVGGSGHAATRLILNSMRGWFRALMLAGEEIARRSKDSAPPVDVIVTTVGHLGRYQYCRETGLWYSGSLLHHQVGN